MNVKIINTKFLRYYFPIFLVISVSIFLRLFLLTSHSLWYDEGLSLTISDGPTLQDSISRVTERKNADRFQPLYFIILFWWRQAFGDSEFTLRSLSALLGSGSVVMIYLTASRLYSKNHALWSSVILTFSSFAVYYSQEVRPYALLTFLASLQLYYFSRALDDGGNKGILRWFFWIFTAIGFFANVTMGIFTLAICLSHLVVERNVRYWLKWWIPAALFSMPALLFYAIAPHVSDPTSIAISRKGLPIVQNIIFVLYGILVGTTYGPPVEQLQDKDKIKVLLDYWPHLFVLFVICTTIILALVVSLLGRLKSSKYQRIDYFFASLLVTSFSLALVFAFIVKLNWVPRHSFYLCLPLSILIPSAFSQNRQMLEPRFRFQWAKVAVTFLVVLNIYSLSNYYFKDEYRRDDYRSAAQYLTENRDATSQSISLWGSLRLLRYYGDNRTLNGWNLPRNEDLAEQVRKMTPNAETVFISVNREYRLGPKGSVEKYMSDLYTLNSQVDFPYFNVYRFAKNKL